MGCELTNAVRYYYSIGGFCIMAGRKSGLLEIRCLIKSENAVPCSMPWI